MDAAGRAAAFFSAQQSVIMIPRTGGSGMASTSEEMSTGFTLNKAGDFAGARKCFLEAYQLRGQRAEAQLSAANMALKLGETATAESEYKAILLRDDLTENLRRMAETKLASVVTTTAPPLFSSPAGTSINRTPSVLMPAVGGTDDASVEMAAGFAANKKGDYELARKHFLAAYDLQGERIEARMSAANMAYKMNDLHTAEDEYKEILQRSDASESLKRMATEKLASLAERTFPDERPASRFGTQAHLLLEPAAAPTLTQPRQRRTPLLKPLLVLCCVVLPILLAVALVKLDWAACEAAPETGVGLFVEQGAGGTGSACVLQVADVRPDTAGKARIFLKCPARRRENAWRAHATTIYNRPPLPAVSPPPRLCSPRYHQLLVASKAPSAPPPVVWRDAAVVGLLSQMVLRESGVLLTANHLWRPTISNGASALPLHPTASLATRRARTRHKCRLCSSSARLASDTIILRALRRSPSAIGALSR